MPSPLSQNDKDHIENCAIAVVDAGFHGLEGFDGYSYGVLAGHDIRTKQITGNEMTMTLYDDWTVTITVSAVRKPIPPAVSHNS